MGQQNVRQQTKADEIRVFLRHLIKDVRALEHMLKNGMVESNVRRIGAEQELFLADKNWRPAPCADKVIRTLDDRHFTPELALFNLEFNLEPLNFGGSCLSQMESRLNDLLEKARLAAECCGCRIVMTGILPSLQKSDLDLKNMTPNPRYFALNDALTKLRGGDYEFLLKGMDELHVHHDSILVEACNTSFQVHFQVGPSEFPQLYNAAQAALGPVMAAAANSALLLGKRLWWETRVGLFQQSIDTRRTMPHLREQVPRVSFGRDWVKHDALEIFREDIARFRTLLSMPMDEDPFEALHEGRTPLLQALVLHNSTVYRWNRVCYGISDGKPHLRIENRILPSGPTPRDEVANAAFWYGLISGIASEYGEISEHLSFDAAQTNFFSAAQSGLNAQLAWTEGRLLPAPQLIRETFLPLARRGLENAGLEKTDVDCYLSVIDERVKNGQTGAQWQLASLAAMPPEAGVAERMSAVTAATVDRQKGNQPVHTWSLATIDEGGGWIRNFLTVEQCMNTDLVTVNEEEPVDLVAQLMDWNHVRHVLVEDAENRLVGIVSQRALLRLVGTYHPEQLATPMPISEVMLRDPIVVSPETSTLKAITLMRDKGMSCLPVVKNEHLVGVINETQFMAVARLLLEKQLQESESR